MAKVLSEKSFIHIAPFMVTDLKLKGNELLIYALISGFNQDDESEFHGSLEFLQTWTNSSKQGVLNALKSLCNAGLLNKVECKKDGKKCCIYTANSKVKKVDLIGQESLPAMVKKVDLIGQESGHNNKYISNIDIINISNENESLRKELEEAKATISKLKDSAKASSKKTSKKKSMTEDDVNKYWSQYSPDTRKQYEDIYRMMYQKARSLDPKFGRTSIQCHQNIIKIFEYAKNNDRDVHEIEKVVTFGLKDSFWAGIITTPEGLIRNYEKLVAKMNSGYSTPKYQKQSLVGSEFDKQHQNQVFDHKDEGGW